MCFINVSAIDWNANALARLSDEHWEIDAYTALAAEQDAALATVRARRSRSRAIARTSRVR